MPEQERNKSLDKKSVLIKAESYCAYQERSQYEVRLKLIEWGIYHDDLEQILAELIEENFLNEERFANMYTLGKFRIKNWGKRKIMQGLKFKKVPDQLIKKALLNINPDEYKEKLNRVLDKKRKELREKDLFKLKYKLTQYAISRGFESDLISYVLKDKDLKL